MRHVFSMRKANEYYELPELTDEMFDRAVYTVGGVEKPAPRRRGSKKENIIFSH